MKKYGFTLVELLGVIIILGVIALMTFPIVNKSIKNSKEKALEQVINNIEEAAYKYSISNDIGYQNFYNKLELSKLIDSGMLKDNIINPVTDEQMQGCVLYKWVEEYKQYEFKYDEECNITVNPIYDTIIEQFSYLETNGNGCVTSTSNNYSYMGGCYLKGNPDNNYIWYSGFLWRIMGINADGTIRMITDENVTAIPWGDQNTAENWNESYAKDWLNNYFYPRLKGNNIIKEATWCNEVTTSSSSARTECTNNLSKEKSKIASITLDEYNLSGGVSSYLNIGQTFALMTPNNSYNIWYIYNNAISEYKIGYGPLVAGIRAVININSDVIITSGNGTLGEIWSSEIGPYILNEDKKVEITGKLNEKATSGEYVLFAGKKYRVVDKDSEGNTKLILDGYYEENGEVFSQNVDFKFSTTTGIGQKLNTDVLNWITNNSDTEKGKLVIDYTWYSGNLGVNKSYKILLDETNQTKIVNATVGLIRIGEMLSGQSSSILTKGYTTISSSDNAYSYWSMTIPWGISNYGLSFSSGVVRSELRPVIVVNSDVTITSGNGTWSSPYQI